MSAWTIGIDCACAVIWSFIIAFWAEGFRPRREPSPPVVIGWDLGTEFALIQRLQVGERAFLIRPAPQISHPQIDDLSPHVGGLVQVVRKDDQSGLYAVRLLPNGPEFWASHDMLNREVDQSSRFIPETLASPSLPDPQRASGVRERESDAAYRERLIGRIYAPHRLRAADWGVDENSTFLMQSYSERYGITDIRFIEVLMAGAGDRAPATVIISTTSTAVPPPHHPARMEPITWAALSEIMCGAITCEFEQHHPVRISTTSVEMLTARPYNRTTERSIALLKEWLTPEQLAQFDRSREFEVIGGHTGNRYRITPRQSYNIHELGADGAVVDLLCLEPAVNFILPAGDIMLAQKIALEANEIETLKLANRHSTHVRIQMPRLFGGGGARYRGQPDGN